MDMDAITIAASSVISFCLMLEFEVGVTLQSLESHGCLGKLWYTYV